MQSYACIYVFNQDAFNQVQSKRTGFLIQRLAKARVNF